MKLFYPEIVNSADVHSQGVGEHNSVSSGPDNGALNCDAAHFWNCMRHGTTEQMINNYLGRLAAQTGNLNTGAHGNSGMFEAGSGQATTYNPATDVYSWNAFDWASLFMQLKDKGFAIWTIYSCDTGADADGADLLHRMANLTNRPARARTGLTTCGNDGIGFTGGVWQVAFPGPKPPPPIPKSPGLLAEEYKSVSRIAITPTNFEFDVNDVVSIALKAKRPSGTFSTAIKGAQAVEIVRMLFSAPEVDIGGQPLAMLTGEITLNIAQNAAEAVLTFDIYNDRVMMMPGTTVCRFVPEAFVKSIM
ncbi:hypothetical protein AB4Z51_41680 [Bradyrhizobium sp. 2TAF36]|uniref:hypothetical protein n=1 Tax=Bradyrhizobium sp. 2TAF36 TaxID=3233016 RepID=UPI003F8E16A0